MTMSSKSFLSILGALFRPAPSKTWQPKTKTNDKIQPGLTVTKKRGYKTRTCGNPALPTVGGSLRLHVCLFLVASLAAATTAAALSLFHSGARSPQVGPLRLPTCQPSKQLIKGFSCCYHDSTHTATSNQTTNLLDNSIVTLATPSQPATEMAWSAI
ncbi:hypothetical protein BD289DRAFT_109940 [Coniella lustricola]|uniref:Uncharacterized protein n=1 Tax=Coniella lustricola TaxID=2025994 RepID=A0A2T2ZXC9_9PEZI|nr:hypothetical protein BD289DRAFT_109940 [Coniella lustricola]